MNRRSFLKAFAAFVAAPTALTPPKASVPPPPKDRKLRAVWSRDSAEDLRQWHKLDCESELTELLAREINQEIDQEIMACLRAAA